MSKHNGKDYAKWIISILAVAGIIWNAAVLHNDVKHNKDTLAEIKQENKQIQGDIKGLYLIMTGLELSERKKENGKQKMVEVYDSLGRSNSRGGFGSTAAWSPTRGGSN